MTGQQRISDMTTLTALPSTGAVVPVVSSGANYQFDIAPTLTAGTRYEAGQSIIPATAFIDTFDRSNRLLNGDNGWTVAGAGASTLAITDGQVYDPGQRNYYLYRSWPNATETTRWAFLIVTFADGSTTPTADTLGGAIAFSDDPNTLQNLMAHTEFYRDHFAVKKEVGGGGFTSIGSGTYPMIPPNTPTLVAVGLDITAGQCFVKIRGKTWTFTHTGLTANLTSKVYFQAFNDPVVNVGSAYKPRFAAAGLGEPSRIPMPIVAGAGAPQDASLLYGLGYTSFFANPPFTTSVNGWYPIADQAAAGGFAIRSIIEIEARSANGLVQYGQFWVSASSTGTPSITQLNSDGATLFTAVRCSADGASAVRLDVQLAYAATSALDIYVTRRGNATLVNSPPARINEAAYTNSLTRTITGPHQPQ
jgi:hypothetical protein